MAHRQLNGKHGQLYDYQILVIPLPSIGNTFTKYLVKAL